MQSTDKKPLIVGLTGGIGSGKSTAASVFARLGIPVYQADDHARTLADSDPDIRSQIAAEFGTRALTTDGLNRPYLSKTVFTNPEKLQKLNSIIHPYVRKHFHLWYSRQKSLYIVKEAAILFEAGTSSECDLIINVIAPEEVRVKRVVHRSGLTREEVHNRIRRQWTDSQRMAWADYNILNDGNHSLIHQILHIHEDIFRRANQRS